MALTAPATSTEGEGAATKYVSGSGQSSGEMPSIPPDTPPSVKKARNPTPKYSGVLNSSVPRHSVAIQLKILIPVGTAMIIELSMKNASTVVDRGVANM